MSRSEKLAAALLADRVQHATKQSRHNIISCFSCGTTFVYRGRQVDLHRRFCSVRCQMATRVMSSNASMSAS